MYVKKKQILYEIHAIPYILEKLKEKVQGKPIQYNGHILNIKGAITPIRNLDDLERYYIQAGNQHNIVQFTPLIAFNDEQVQTLQSIFEKEIKYRDQDEISQYPEELERGTGGFSVGKVLSSEYLDQEVEVTEEQEEIRVEKVKEIDKNWEMMQTEKHNNKNSNNNNNSNNKNNKNKNKNTADQQGSHIQKKSVYLLMENNLKFFEKSDVKECIEEIVDNSLFLFE